MRVATLTVGIQNYSRSGYREDGRQLRFAAEDARQFHAYARAGSTKTHDGSLRDFIFRFSLKTR
jgi:hypothetical protein